MANVKITDLPAATAATGADVVPIVQSGTTKKLSFTSLLASPTLFGSGVSTFLATPSSANLRAAVTDETGTGSLVFATSPTLVTPTLGAATATSINKVALTAPATSATLTIADGKTLTASNSLTLAGTDATTMTFPTTSATIARTDAGQTFTGAQIISTNASGTLAPAGIGGTTVLHLHGTDASAARQMISGYGAGVGLDFRRANGTAASPTAVTTNNVIGGISASGYGTSAYASAFRSAVLLYAGETWTNTAQGTFLTFTITPLGGTATTEVARIESNGRLQVGNAVSLNGPALTTTAPADFCSVNASTYVDNTTAASGTAAHGTANSFGAKAIAASNASVTYTNASTIYVHGAPTAGSNVTITNPWAMYVAGGKSYFGADVSVGTGNLAFTGTAQRITGDMSNATLANRLAFQTSTANSATVLTVIPSGTNTQSILALEGDSALTNGSNILVSNTGSDARFASGIRGTGTYLPMTLYTGGSERVRIDTSGNVGVGTASPGSRLDVNGLVSVRNGGGGEGGQLDLYNPDNTTAGLVVDVSSADTGRIFSTRNNSVLQVGQLAGTGGVIALFTGAAERMRIDSSGNVGIGTNTPSGFSAKLVSASTTNQLVLTTADTRKVALFNYSVDTFNIGVEDGYGVAAIAFRNNGSERMRIDSSGNVGIGTASPSGPFSVQRSDTSTTIGGSAAVLKVNNSSGTLSSTSGIEFFATGDLTVNTGRAAGIYGVYSSFNAAGIGGELVFATNTPGDATIDERMRIDSSGNVLVGTSSNATGIATRFLTKAGSAYAAGAVFESDGSAFNWARTDWKNANIASPGIIYMDQTGLFVIRNDGASPIAFYTNGATERMRIDASGNVNIATAGAKITGDFSNATVANRVAFQSSTTNGDTGISFIPNGTSTTSTLALLNTSNTTNFSFARLQCTSTAFTIAATRGGSGSYLPIEFQTSGIKRGSIDIDGNVIVGQSAIDVGATAGFLWIPSCAGAPTGSPTAPYTNAAALVADTTNNRLYVRVGSTWRYATLT